MRNLFFTLAFGAMASMSWVFAQEKQHFFNITDTEDPSVSLTLPFAVTPVITSAYDATEGADYLVVSAEEVEPTYFPLSSHYTISYTTEDTPTAIREVLATTAVSLRGDNVIVSGLQAGETVSLFGTDGQRVATAQASATGVAVLSINTAEHGVFVISSGKSVFKFKK